MNPDKLKTLFPQASESFIKKNLAHSVAPDTKLKPNPVNEPVAAKERAGSDVGFRHVLITSYRVRLLDGDNIFGKYIIDSLVRAGLLRDDSPAWVKVQTCQVKVDMHAKERTHIEIFTVEKL